MIGFDDQIYERRVRSIKSERLLNERIDCLTKNREFSLHKRKVSL